MTGCWCVRECCWERHLLNFKKCVIFMFNGSTATSHYFQMSVITCPVTQPTHVAMDWTMKPSSSIKSKLCFSAASTRTSGNYSSSSHTVPKISYMYCAGHSTWQCPGKEEMYTATTKSWKKGSFSIQCHAVGWITRVAATIPRCWGLMEKWSGCMIST